MLLPIIPVSHVWFRIHTLVLDIVVDFTDGDYGKGLYFSKFPSRAAEFSVVSHSNVVNLSHAAFLLHA